VNHAANSRKRLIKENVCWQIGRRVQITFNAGSVQTNDDQVLDFEFVIRDAARLDNDESAFSIDTASIAKRIEDQSTPLKLQIRFENLSPQLF
jgi:hypothetical protein